MMRMYVKSFTKENIRKCHEEYDKLDFRFPLDIDAITDSPTAEHFWDLYRTYPNAKFVLTTRNGTEWAMKRIRHGPEVPAIMWRPCGLQASQFTIEAHAKAFDAYNNFVQCVVPPERLLSICFLCHKVQWGTFGELARVNTSDFGIDPTAPIEKFNMPEEKLANLMHAESFTKPPPLRINICAGIIYGDYNGKNIKYFLSYHRKIKVGKIYAYLHPSIEKTFTDNVYSKGFETEVLEDFDVNDIDLLRKYEEDSTMKCIQKSKEEGFDWTFIISFDDFLYFNLSYIATLWGLVNSFGNKSTVRIYRKYYEVGICTKEMKTPIVWDMPYVNKSRIDRKGLWALRPKLIGKDFRLDSRMGEDISIVDAHLKHYDQYWRWKRKCRDESKSNYELDTGFAEWKRYLRWFDKKLWIR